MTIIPTISFMQLFAGSFNLPAAVLISIMSLSAGLLIGWLTWGRYKKRAYISEKNITALTELNTQKEEYIIDMEIKMDDYKNKIGDLEEALQESKEKKKQKKKAKKKQKKKSKKP